MRHALAAALLLLAAPAGAATIVLDFEEEALAGHDVPVVSVECGCVQLSGSPLGVGIRFYDLEGDTILVAGRDLEGGSLVLDFLVPVLSVALDFGGDTDDPYVDPRLARLRGFSGGVEVARDETLANRNGAIDQTLFLASLGTPMDQAIFSFSQLGETEPYSPYIGRIVLTTVPEPGTLGLVALALAVTGRGRRRVLK